MAISWRAASPQFLQAPRDSLERRQPIRSRTSRR